MVNIIARKFSIETRFLQDLPPSDSWRGTPKSGTQAVAQLGETRTIPKLTCSRCGTDPSTLERDQSNPQNRPDTPETGKESVAQPEDRIGTGPPRARTEVVYVDLGYWAILQARKQWRSQ